MKTRTSGFTIIEILVAIVLLGVLVIVILQPVTSLFKQNANSSDTLTATNETQEDLEKSRRLVLSNYSGPPRLQTNTLLENVMKERNDELIAKGLPDRVTITCKNITVTGNVNAAHPDCADPAYDEATMKRITVVRTQGNGKTIRLYLDVSQ